MSVIEGSNHHPALIEMVGGMIMDSFSIFMLVLNFISHCYSGFQFTLSTLFLTLLVNCGIHVRQI